MVQETKLVLRTDNLNCKKLRFKNKESENKGDDSS